MINSQATFSVKLLQKFVVLVAAEIGEKNLPVVLHKSSLPKEWAESKHFEKVDAQAAAEAYAGLQKAIRAYYGRGARGILQRVGSKFWEVLLEDASFGEKTQAKLLRGLPDVRRRKAALDLLARLLDTKADEVIVHTLDLNLLLVDTISPTTFNQSNDAPICYVTHGLIREAIYWAISKDALITESSCKAMGEKNCEFGIEFGEI